VKVVQRCDDSEHPEYHIEFHEVGPFYVPEDIEPARPVEFHRLVLVPRDSLQSSQESDCTEGEATPQADCRHSQQWVRVEPFDWMERVLQPHSSEDHIQQSSRRGEYSHPYGPDRGYRDGEGDQE